MKRMNINPYTLLALFDHYAIKHIDEEKEDKCTRHLLLNLTSKISDIDFPVADRKLKSLVHIPPLYVSHSRRRLDVVCVSKVSELPLLLVNVHSGSTISDYENDEGCC